MSPKFAVEVVIEGRVILTVEAEDENDAENKVFYHKDYPYLDKVYHVEVGAYPGALPE